VTRPGRPTTRRHPEAGVTLVEALVALMLFALIGAAGFTVLDQVIRVQSRTEGRLQHLAEVQRTMHLLTQDFMQAKGGSLGFADGAVGFRRSAAQGQFAVRYGLEGSALLRRVSGEGGTAASQVLLTGVSAASWQFYSPEAGWADTWPVEPALKPSNPEAVLLDLTLAGPGPAGRLRRIAVLPAEVSR
jgi:general secretion pathway protein J